MDKDRNEGALDQAKGAVKETLGKVVGSDELRAEGAADKLAGKAKEGVGEAEDVVRDTLKRRSACSRPGRVGAFRRRSFRPTPV